MAKGACPSAQNQVLGEFIKGGIWGPSPGSEVSHELTLETLSHILGDSSPKMSPSLRRILTAHVGKDVTQLLCLKQ